jgi:hypothetical protein
MWLGGARMTDVQDWQFWLLGVVFWPVMSLLGRRAMRERVASGSVSQAEVDRFAMRFTAILVGLCLVCAGADFIGGASAYRIAALAGALVCLGFLAWLWRSDGARTLVLFGPFINMPLK